MGPMTPEHQRIREQLGAFALGVADEEQRFALQFHLEDCAECRDELYRLQEVAGQLSVLRAGVPPELPSRATRLFARAAEDRRRRLAQQRRLRAVSALAAAAVVVLLAVLVWPAGPPAGRSVQFAQAPEGVTASAQIQDWGWGAQVQLEIAGLPGDQLMTVWLEQPDGNRMPAGSFVTTGNDLRMMMGAGANTTEAVALGVSTADGTTLLRAPLSS